MCNLPETKEKLEEPDALEKLFLLLHIDFCSFNEEESVAIFDAIVEAADFLLTPPEGEEFVCEECKKEREGNMS